MAYNAWRSLFFPFLVGHNTQSGLSVGCSIVTANSDTYGSLACKLESFCLLWLQQINAHTIWANLKLLLDDLLAYNAPSLRPRCYPTCNSTSVDHQSWLTCNSLISYVQCLTCNGSCDRAMGTADLHLNSLMCGLVSLAMLAYSLLCLWATGHLAVFEILSFRKAAGTINNQE